MLSDDPTFVLIPGAWCGAWAWEDVVDRLGDANVVAVDLPSSGTDVATLGDLTADTAHVRQIVDGIEGPVVVCGHSYGGMVVNELADHPSVRHSIYLTAFWPPEPGATMVGMIGDIPGWIVDQGDGSLQVHGDAAIAREALCADVDEAAATELLGRLKLQGAAAFVVPSSGKQHAHPTTYVICEHDKAIPPQAQEAMSAPADHVVRLDAAHFPQASKPDEVARVLLDAAA